MSVSEPATVLAHILLFNSMRTHGPETVRKSIQSLLCQSGFVAGDSLTVQVTDNGSDDAGIAAFEDAPEFAAVQFRRNSRNIGFSGAQNAVARAFLNSDHQYLFLLNPDCVLAPDALQQLVAALRYDTAAGIACPCLLKPAGSGEAILDSAGMHVTPDLRHFDTGCGEIEAGQYRSDAYVFGASGACLLIRKECLEDLCLPPLAHSEDRFTIFPELRDGAEERVDLFDEGFFAYREDADLAWRANLFGWKCRYVASASGFHTRVVHATNRKSLPAALNLHGVRNRFLLQLNNYIPLSMPATILPGLLLRNVVVLCGVLLIERSSLQAFTQCAVLWKRARARRRYIVGRSTPETRRTTAAWFSFRPVRLSCSAVEPLESSGDNRRPEALEM